MTNDNLRYRAIPSPFFAVLVFVAYITTSHTENTCLPGCVPPIGVKGCKAFLTSEPCWIARKSKPTFKQCGCMWKDYLKGSVGGDKTSLFTPDGVQCFVWAVTVCGVAKENVTTTYPPKVEIDYKTGDVYGAPEKANGRYKAAESVGEVFVTEDALKAGKVIFGLKGRRRWLDFDVHYDQFKLAVFGLILLFNVLCVAIAVCCTWDTKSREKEVRLCGDLDLTPHDPNNTNQRSARTISIERFLEKLRLYKRSTSKKNDNPYGLLEMDPVGSVRKKQVHSSMPPVRPTYESTDEQSDLLDSTYEEPLPATREIHPQRSRRDDMSDENTLYENLQPRDHRTVSFNIPRGSHSGELERVGTSKAK